MRLNTYILLLLVFLASFAASFLLPVAEFYKGIVATPIAVTLIAAVYQVLRDNAAHQRQVDLQNANNVFSLGVMSHMAQVAFDKHVEFCEKYMSEVHEAISTLFREGPTEKAMTHSQNFSRLRIEYATWITDDIANKLKPFEDAMFNIGSKTQLWKAVRDRATFDKAYKEAEDSWDGILGGILNKEKTPDESIAVESVKNRVRQILGVQELTQLRGKLIQKAINSVGT